MWRRFSRSLFHNAGWKLGALALSVLLWFGILGEPEMATTHSVPILYKNLPANLLIGSDAIDAVRVELRGPSSRLTSAALAEFEITLDLSTVDGPGERTFTLSDGDVHLPDGVTMLRSIPSQLRLRFARVKSKEVRVELTFSSALPDGLTIVGEEVTPSTERITGPENRIDAIATAQTDPIDLAGITGSGEIHANTFVADPQVWLATSSAVTVRLRIGKK